MSASSMLHFTLTAIQFAVTCCCCRWRFHCSWLEQIVHRELFRVLAVFGDLESVAAIAAARDVVVDCIKLVTLTHEAAALVLVERVKVLLLLLLVTCCCRLRVERQFIRVAEHFHGAAFTKTFHDAVQKQTDDRLCAAEKKSKAKDVAAHWLRRSIGNAHSKWQLASASIYLLLAAQSTLITIQLLNHVSNVVG